MITKHLFPNSFKKYGWLILIPTSILGLLTVIYDYEPSFLNFKVPALFVNQFIGDNSIIGFVKNNLLNEILGILVIISATIVAFSKEKLEDEFISKIRLESLVWAVYVNYAILLISFLFIYDLSFLWVMILNMFTILLFFIT